MTRRVITDGIWTQLQEVMEGILWKLRTGAPWRDIPKEFCSWETAYGRFNIWAAKGL